MILVDTNVLLDVVTDDPLWADWSQQQLNAATLRDRLAINPMVYAEFSSRFTRIEDIDALLAAADITVAEMTRPALFLAGQAFKTYRRRGGHRASVLPDFFIGAHAAAFGAPLIARDARRYRSYFPTVDLIAPD
jgi:predicted nucleic acid-binding protein